VVVEDGTGATLATISRGVGVTTNNVAEYKALLAGLEKAEQLGATSVEVISDSELLVRQMRGEYKVKNAGLKPLHAEALQRTARFGSFAICHAGREHNTKADGLVNLALDEEERAGL
jgi:ribonuclease HI